jgi:hypothetical protein
MDLPPGVNREMWRCGNPGLKSETWGTLTSIVQTCATRQDYFQIARDQRLWGS